MKYFMASNIFCAKHSSSLLFRVTFVKKSQCYKDHGNCMALGYLHYVQHSSPLLPPLNHARDEEPVSQVFYRKGFSMISCSYDNIPLKSNARVFVIVFVFILVFFGQVMSPHHSDQMSQRSQVSWVALCMSKVKVALVSQLVSL